MLLQSPSHCCIAGTSAETRPDTNTPDKKRNERSAPSLGDIDRQLYLVGRELFLITVVVFDNDNNLIFRRLVGTLILSSAPRSGAVRRFEVDVHPGRRNLTIAPLNVSHLVVVVSVLLIVRRALSAFQEVPTVAFPSADFELVFIVRTEAHVAFAATSPISPRQSGPDVVAR